MDVKRFLRTLVFIAVIGAALLPTSPAGASFPGRNGRIVFESYRGSQAGEEYFDLFSLTGSGSDLMQLTNSPGVDFDADVSADGKHIVFISTRTGEYQVYVMRSDGSNVRQLTDAPGTKTFPAWSPDGKRIVYVDWGDGSELKRLTIVRLRDGHARKLPQFYASPDQLDWSPDGDRIAFIMENKDGSSNELFTVHPDGSHLKQVTDTPKLGEWGPDWSPDGRSILVERDRAAEPGQGVWADDIVAIDRDGSNSRDLTNTIDRYEGDPTWSPDGKKIAYVVDTGECSSAEPTYCASEWEIWTMDASGANQAKLFRFPDDPVSHNEIFALDWQARR
jgi:Tol biopolymer transport system component